MNREAFVFRQKIRVAGNPQKETLVGNQFKNIFEALDELAKHGLLYEIEEAHGGRPGEEWPKWMRHRDTGEARQVDSPKHLDELGEEWEPQEAEEAPPAELAVPARTYGGETPGVSGGVTQPLPAGTRTVGEAVRRTDIGEHPIDYPTKDYHGPRPAMEPGKARDEAQKDATDVHGKDPDKDPGSRPSKTKDKNLVQATTGKASVDPDKDKGK